MLVFQITDKIDPLLYMLLSIVFLEEFDVTNMTYFSPLFYTPLSLLLVWIPIWLFLMKLYVFITINKDRKVLF